MNDDGVTEELLTVNDERLEAALRAAFGPPSTAYFSPSTREPSFELGPICRIALRETGDDKTTTVARDGLGVDDRGRYQVLGEIARGGMGVVLKGRDPNLGREVALKVLHASHAHNPAMIQRFVEEAQIGGQLQHPGILPIYDFGLDAEYRPFFTMRLVRGRTLAALLEERAQPSDDLLRFLGIFEQVCQTVAYAHSRGVVHRDLKPSNVMVGAFGEVQVVDWGLAKVIGQASSPEAAIAGENVVTVRSSSSGSTSHQGSVLGTPAYMSPEQASGAVEDLDESTDVFALGACLCEIITGKPPYSGSHREMLENAAAGRIEAGVVRLEASDADRDLVNIAKQCLAREASSRIRQAGDLAHAVRKYLTSLGDRVRAAEIAAAEARATAIAERKAHRRTLLLSGALGLAVLTGAVFAVRFERERSARASQSLAEAAALYPKAVWFREQSNSLPVEFLPTWSEALSHVQRTAETIRDGATNEQLRKDLSSVVRSLRDEKASVDRRIEQLNSSR